MCEAIRQMREESEKIGFERGEDNTKKLVAKNLHVKGMDITEIAQVLETKTATVKGWLK